LAVYAAFSPRPDDLIRLHSLDFDQQSVAFRLADLQNPTLPHWSKHLRGAWWLLSQKGASLTGADVVIGGQVPMGAGMSSSAAIGVLAIEIATSIAGQTYSAPEKALLAVEIEHRFIGVPCGVLDQMASAAAIEGSAMLLDCRSLETRPVRIPRGVSVVVINSMKQRELADSAYAERRAQCESAATALGVKALRDADIALLEAHRPQLDETLYRRARHVITENARTLAMIPILEAEDLRGAGDLLNASHASLRDDYAVSIHELDVLTDLARRHPACYGARIMGGGFGGSAVSLVQDAGVADFQAEVGPAYQQATGYTPEFYVCYPSAGSGVEKL
jgi:galactokinase